MQHNKDVEYQYANIYCATNQFPGFQFLGTHNKPHGVCGLGKNYHMHFYAKLGNGTFAIPCIPCVCTQCNSIYDQPWVTGMPEQKQPLYQPVKYFTYWPV